MKNIDNAFSDVVASCKSAMLEYEIAEYNADDARWLVNVYNRDIPESLLQIEVIDDNGVPKCCVLQKIHFGYRSMSRFMEQLMKAL